MMFRSKKYAKHTRGDVTDYGLLAFQDRCCDGKRKLPKLLRLGNEKKNKFSFSISLDFS